MIVTARAGPMPWCGGQGVRGAVDDVVAGERDGVGVHPVGDVTPSVQPGGRATVTSSQSADRLVDGHQRVEAVLARRADAEVRG